MSFKTTKLNSPHFAYIFLLLLLSIFAYWQISFLKYSVTHDMINCWIPWRYYISECFQNHIFPFWNPYQQLGYPIHADLQGPTWYLESILLSITTGQTNYTLHYLFIFYVFMAGMGMYFLSLAFQNNRTVAFLVGACYMLSGFFVAHVQHFYAIIGAAWLPYIIMNYYKMHLDKSYLRALYTSIFMFFNLTGGNHTFSIILIYLFAIISGYFIVTALIEKNKDNVINYIKLNFAFGAVTILFASVVLVAFYQTSPYIARLSGMIYRDAAVCPLSPQSLLSLLVPFSTVNSVDFFNTDQSMCNIYVSIVMLLFIILAFTNKKTSFEKVLLTFAIICLFASFGAYTPIHKFLFNYFPLINRFRFPSYFSLFSILVFLLLAGKQLAAFIAETEINYKKIIRIAIFIGLSILLLIVIAVIKNQGQRFFFLNKFDSIFDFLRTSSFYQNILFQGSIQLLFIGIFIAVITTSVKKHWFKITCILIILDLFIAMQLNIAYVGVSPASPKELHDYLTTLPKGFPVPANNNIIENTEQIGQKHGLYRNTSAFHKRISADVFNSYVFKNYLKLADSFPNLFNSIQKNPLLYFSDVIYSDSEAAKLDSSDITNKTIVLSDYDHSVIASTIKNNNPGSAEENIFIKSFNPNELNTKIRSPKTQLLTILQSYYSGWEVYIDNYHSKILVSNYLTMSVLIPAGEHEVKFIYKNPAIVTAAIISYGSFLIALIILSFIWIKKNKNYWAPVVIWMVLIGSACFYLF
ncbi:MAG: YfhO family protein [Bacteroidota bacterium]